MKHLFMITVLLLTAWVSQAEEKIIAQCGKYRLLTPYKQTINVAGDEFEMPYYTIEVEDGGFREAILIPNSEGADWLSRNVDYEGSQLLISYGYGVLQARFMKKDGSVEEMGCTQP